MKCLFLSGVKGKTKQFCPQIWLHTYQTELSHIVNSLLTSFNQLKVYLNFSFGSIKQCKWLYLMYFTYTEISGKSFSEDVSVQTVCIDSTVFLTAPTTWAFYRHHYVDICWVTSKRACPHVLLEILKDC